MRDPDAPRPDPVLNAKAKHYERELHKIFAVDTAAIWLTWDDWKTAETNVTALAKAVRTTKQSLQEPSGEKGWSGPAADAAYTSLDRLSTSLDDRSREIADVKGSLDDVYKAVNLAKDEFNSKVNSISTWVDPAAHKKLPDGAPPKADIGTYGVTDSAAVSAEEDKKWEARNQAAKTVLEALGADTQAASAKMPIETNDETGTTPYSNQGPAANNHTSGTATNGGNTGRPPGSTVGPGFPIDPVIDPVIPDDTGLIPVIPTEEPIPVIDDHVDPGLPPVDYDPISSDGDPTGTTGLPTGTGPGNSQGGYPSGGGSGIGGAGAGGVAAGGVGGAAGLGSLLGKRPGGGMFSSGGSAKGGSASGRATGGGAGTRGSAVRSGGARAGGSQMVPGGGGSRGGGAGRGGGGAAGRGSAVKGSTGSGKYGVPKVGGKGTGGIPAGGAGQGGKGAGKAGGRGTGGRGAGAAGAAGRGGSRKGDKSQAQDVDKLTHEDEEKWFEGTEESSPQVWE